MLPFLSPFFCVHYKNDVVTVISESLFSVSLLIFISNNVKSYIMCQNAHLPCTYAGDQTRQPAFLMMAFGEPIRAFN